MIPIFAMYALANCRGQIGRGENDCGLTQRMCIYHINDSSIGANSKQIKDNIIQR
jgi:hypothetical protein